MNILTKQTKQYLKLSEQLHEVGLSCEEFSKYYKLKKKLNLVTEIKIK